MLAPPSDYVALKTGFTRLVNLADLCNESSHGRLSRRRKDDQRESAICNTHGTGDRAWRDSRDCPDDAVQTMFKHWHMERDVSVNAYKLVKAALNPGPTEKGVELMARWQTVA